MARPLLKCWQQTRAAVASSLEEVVVSERGATTGVLLVALAGVFWSLQGLTVRLVEVAEPAQITFWRACGQLVSVLAIVAVVSRGRVLLAFRRAGPLGAFGGLCVLVASTSFVFALVETTVANVVFIMAASPLFAALGAWLLMRETLDRRTFAAMFVALAGIGVMVSEGVAGGSVAGYVFALGATIGFAGIAVVARRGGGVDMLPMGCWGAVFTLTAMLLLTGGDLWVPPRDLAACLVSGGVLTAGGATCFMIGARYVPAGVLAFLSLTEIVLAPIWVWLAFDEVPTVFTMYGGAIVLVALAYEGVARVRAVRKARRVAR